MNNRILNVRKLLDQKPEANCIVVGDIILDKYIFGDVGRISPEAPIPVVHVEGEKYVLGGAANVAGNICGYYMQPYLCGRIGNDIGGKKIKKLLENMGIRFLGIESEEECTTIKTRITGMGQQIVRIDEEDLAPITDIQAVELLDKIKSVINQIQVVVLSDYNKGVCTEYFCQELIQLCQKNKKTIIIDPKSKDWSKYKGCHLITPNFKEYREAVGINLLNQAESIIEHADALMKHYEIHNILVTRSQYGMILIQKNGKVNDFDTVAQEVFDVSGAGDTVIATIAALLAKEVPLEIAVEISNQAAGLAVSKNGTYMVRIEELNQFMESKEYDIKGKIVPREKLSIVLEQWRKNNKKIVFTNGCFDILHVGHITYLNEARKLGDKLIVGLNSDASVKRLKGTTRPINTEEDRALLLAALQSVDLVVIFEEDTPYTLIKYIQPDVLVKGGDYKPEEVVGREFATELKLINFVDGYSTTGIIKDIRHN